MLTILLFLLQCSIVLVVGVAVLGVLIDLICYFVSPSNSFLNDIIPSKKAWKEQQEKKVGWFDDTQIKEFPTISFKQFEQFYYLNPESWTLKDCRVFKNNDNSLSFTFTYTEWLKYLKFKKHIASNKEKQATYERTIREMKVKDDTTRKILEAVQQDIDNIRSKAQDDIAKSVEFMQEVEL